MKQLAFLVVAVILLFSVLMTSCAYENLTPDSSDNNSSQLLHRKQQEIDAYAKAIRKLPYLYGSISTRGGIPIVEDSYPLWYGDTAITINPTDPYAPDKPGNDPTPSVANDSIYAYVFNLASEEGSIVIGVDDDLPDMIMYSKGRNFMKTPFKIKRYTDGKGEESESWRKFIQRVHAIYNEREKMLRRMIADFTVQYKNQVNLMVDTFRKQEAQWSATPGWAPPYVVERDTLQKWTKTRVANYPDGMCPTQWLNIPPYTSEIQHVYGDNANCWDIIPSTAMFLATTRPSDEYQGWPLKWDEWTGQTSEGVSDDNLQEIAHLFFLLGLPENLNVNYQSTQDISVFDNVLRTIKKFGVTLPYVVDREYPLYRIIDEIDANRPCIGIFNFTKGNDIVKKGSAYSFVADEYETFEMQVMETFNDGVQCPRSFRKYYVNLKMSDLDAYYPSCYWCWEIIDPNEAAVIQMLHNGRSPIKFPKVSPIYNKVALLSVDEGI